MMEIDSHTVFYLFFSFSFPYLDIFLPQKIEIYSFYLKRSLSTSPLLKISVLLIFLFLAQTFYNTPIVTEKFTTCEIQRFTF